MGDTSEGRSTTAEDESAESTEGASGADGGESSSGMADERTGSLADEELDSKTEAALKRMRTVSYLLDDAVRIPGTSRRVGIDPVLSILPVGGDAAGLVLSLYPIAEAVRIGVPRSLLAKMLVNVGIDAGVGSIPVLGTIFDAFWKANERNVELLEAHLASG